MMDPTDKFSLIMRTLALRHKLKVHETLKTPDNHEDLAHLLLGKWELEDELRAVEQILAHEREQNITAKRTLLEEEWLGKKKQGPIKRVVRRSRGD